MRFGSLVNVLVVITLILYIVTLKCIYTSEQSNRMLSAILVSSYKHHLEYQMSVSCPACEDQQHSMSFVPPLP